MTRSVLLVPLAALSLFGCTSKTSNQSAPPSTAVVVSTASPQSAPGAVTTAAVIGAFQAKGLPIGEQRDNTKNMCEPGASLKCTKVTTTDLFSIYEWADAGQAADFAKGSDSYIVTPTLTVRFDKATDRAPYEAALGQLKQS